MHGAVLPTPEQLQGAGESSRLPAQHPGVPGAARRCGLPQPGLYHPASLVHVYVASHILTAPNKLRVNNQLGDWYDTLRKATLN